MSLAQTKISLKAQAKDVDFSTAEATKPAKTGVSLPATCEVGELFFKTDSAPGENIYGCTAQNTWTLQAEQSGASLITDSVGTDELNDGADTPVTGQYVKVSSDASKVEYSTPASSELSDSSNLVRKTDNIAALADVSGKNGTSGTVATVDGATFDGHCAHWDASGNLADTGAACGSGGGTAEPGGSDGEIQVNDAGVLGGRVVGFGLAMNNTTLGVDASLIPGLFEANTFMGVNLFRGQLQSSGAEAEVNFSGVDGGTRPVQTGTTTPLPCAEGQLFFDTDAVDGNNLFGCTSSGTWVLLGNS